MHRHMLLCRRAPTPRGTARHQRVEQELQRTRYVARVAAKPTTHKLHQRQPHTPRASAAPVPGCSICQKRKMAGNPNHRHDAWTQGRARRLVQMQAAGKLKRQQCGCQHRCNRRWSNRGEAGGGMHVATAVRMGGQNMRGARRAQGEGGGGVAGTTHAQAMHAYWADNNHSTETETETKRASTAGLIFTSCGGPGRPPSSPGRRGCRRRWWRSSPG